MKTAKEIVDEKFYIARCVTDGMVNYEEAAIAAVNEARKEAILECIENAHVYLKISKSEENLLLTGIEFK